MPHVGHRMKDSSHECIGPDLAWLLLKPPRRHVWPTVAPVMESDTDENSLLLVALDVDGRDGCAVVAEDDAGGLSPCALASSTTRSWPMVTAASQCVRVYATGLVSDSCV